MKRVVNKLSSNEVSVDAFDALKIYAVNHYGYVYKLVSTNNRAHNDERWIFKSMHDSCRGSSGYYNTAKAAINVEMSSGDDVYEFESVKEFARWLLENVKE